MQLRGENAANPPKQIVIDEALKVRDKVTLGCISSPSFLSLNDWIRSVVGAASQRRENCILVPGNLQPRAIFVSLEGRQIDSMPYIVSQSSYATTYLSHQNHSMSQYDACTWLLMLNVTLLFCLFETAYSQLMRYEQLHCQIYCPVPSEKQVTSVLGDMRKKSWFLCCIST